MMATIWCGPHGSGPTVVCQLNIPWPVATGLLGTGFPSTKTNTAPAGSWGAAKTCSWPWAGFVMSVPPDLGAAVGAVRTDPVELMDLGPTLADLAGAKVTGPTKGTSLVSALADPATSPRTDAISQVRHETTLATTHWKAAVNSSGEIYMLFDLRADPDERLNLTGSPEHAAVSEELRRRLIQRTARLASREAGKIE